MSNIDKKANSLVFNSEGEIEKYYRSEKQKAKNLLREIERKKAVSLISVAKKQLEQVRIEKYNLDVIHKDLSNHIRKISQKIREIIKEKENNIQNIGSSSRLKTSMRRLEREAAGILNARKNLTLKEKMLVDKMNKLVDENKGKFRVTDEDASNKLSIIEDRKEKLIEEARTLLKEERSGMYIDNKVIESIGRIAEFRIKRLNKKLRELKKAKMETLKQVQLLEVSEEKAKEKIRLSEKKLESIKRKYRRILG